MPKGKNKVLNIAAARESNEELTPNWFRVSCFAVTDKGYQWLESHLTEDKEWTGLWLVKKYKNEYLKLDIKVQRV